MYVAKHDGTEKEIDKYTIIVGIFSFPFPTIGGKNILKSANI